jgi:hypothetical protein
MLRRHDAGAPAPALTSTSHHTSRHAPEQHSCRLQRCIMSYRPFDLESPTINSFNDVLLNRDRTNRHGLAVEAAFVTNEHF